MLLVMVAIGGTDILFALDSIPAIFGLTQNVYIVFTATAFSLMGLRQLYFLIDGLLDRLIYLAYGLAAILPSSASSWCSTPCTRTTCRSSTAAQPVPVIEISTATSLSVIIGVLVITVVASLLSKAGKAQTSINNARRHAVNYLDLEYTADAAERERIYRHADRGGVPDPGHGPEVPEQGQGHRQDSGSWWRKRTGSTRSTWPAKCRGPAGGQVGAGPAGKHLRPPVRRRSRWRLAPGRAPRQGTRRQ